MQCSRLAKAFGVADLYRKAMSFDDLFRKDRPNTMLPFRLAQGPECAEGQRTAHKLCDFTVMERLNPKIVC
jgi:hypothetical protein